MSRIVEPKREALKIRSIFSPVITSRGCPYYCSFCSLTHLYGRKYRPRPIENIVNEIKGIDRKILVFVHDSSVTIDKDYAKSLFKAMIPLKKKFIAWGSAPILQDEQLLELSKKAGCMMWGVGFESISQDSLTSDANKNYKVDSYRELVRKIHRHNIEVHGAFVFGFDNDTTETFDNTLNAAFDYDIDSAEFSILTPFPITRLFKKLDKEKRILTYDWAKYDLHHVVFQPKNMTPEELFEGVERISMKFYAYYRIIQRVLNIGIRDWNMMNIFSGLALNWGMGRYHLEYTYF
jgi:radical SAM superfamily enzyme YgiQ (UPF0313 family)